VGKENNKDMPKEFSPIRKALLKKSLLKGKSIRKSMIDAGYSERYAHGNCDRNEPVVKACLEEITEEVNKPELIKKAYKALKDNLNADRPSDRNTAASAILDFTEGKKSEVKADVTTQERQAINDLISNRLKALELQQ